MKRIIIICAALFAVACSKDNKSNEEKSKEIAERYVQTKIVPVMKADGFEITSVQVLSSEFIKGEFQKNLLDDLIDDTIITGKIWYYLRTGLIPIDTFYYTTKIFSDARRAWDKADPIAGFYIVKVQIDCTCFFEMPYGEYYTDDSFKTIIILSNDLVVLN